MGMANLEFKTPSELLDDIVLLRKALEQANQRTDEIARQISTKIMKERSRGGDQKAWSLPEWESYIRSVFTSYRT
jgi:hypothetical protein